jgi:chaperonin GroES
MSVNVKPLADRVLVEPEPAEKIIAVGNGKVDEPMTVVVGDTVLYGKYSGTEINVEGSDYLIMRESDIFAIV